MYISGHWLHLTDKEPTRLTTASPPARLTPNPKPLSCPALPCSTGRVAYQKDYVWHSSKFISPPHLLRSKSLCLMRCQFTKPSLVCKTDQFLLILLRDCSKVLPVFTGIEGYLLTRPLFALERNCSHGSR